MGLLSFLGFGNDKLRDALKRGAVVIDVRNGYEYDRGRVRNSINIPVDRIRSSISRIKGFNKPVILVCSSGNRSAEARQYLKEAGVDEVYNGGSWERVSKLVETV